MKFYCIGDEDTVRGFRLAGVEGRAVTGPADAAAAFAHVIAAGGTGILIITQAVAAGIRRQVDAVRSANSLPLVVEVPGPDGPMPGRKSLRQFVQEAIGISIGQEEAP